MEEKEKMKSLINMVGDDGGVFSEEKVESYISAILDIAYEHRLTLLELGQACKAVYSATNIFYFNEKMKKIDEG